MVENICSCEAKAVYIVELFMLIPSGTCIFLLGLSVLLYLGDFLFDEVGLLKN